MAIIDELNIQKQYDQQAAGDLIGSPGGLQVVATEYGDAALHRTVLTLTDLPVSIVSVTTGNGVGGALIYQLAQGHIRFRGATAKLSLRIATAKQADFTDATPEGDLGIGTVAPANADALGTDATDDDICTATAFLCSAYADTSVNLPPEADLIKDGTTTAVAVYLNALVDAVDINDGVTTEILVSGTVVLTWQNLGDF